HVVGSVEDSSFHFFHRPLRTVNRNAETAANHCTDRRGFAEAAKRMVIPVVIPGGSYDSECEKNSHANRFFRPLDGSDARRGGTGEGHRRRSSPDARHRAASPVPPAAVGVEC